MASVVIPGQPKRWGCESTNFYRNSTSDADRAPSQQKTHRCLGNQYTNSGHFHVSTKTLNLDPPLDKYGVPSTYRLRPEDQRLPKALATAHVQKFCMSRDQPVNLYQSHQQSHYSYSMTRPPLKRSNSVSDAAGLARSLSSTFYITSYQSDIARNAGSVLSRLDPSPAHASLTGQLELRRDPATESSAPVVPVPRPRPARVSSAPPSRIRAAQRQPAAARLARAAPPTEQPRLQRRRSFSAFQRSLPTRGEMLKDIFSVFPSPQPQPVSQRASRPSSAVSLRRGEIPALRGARGAWS